jgi:hypothetical protein
VSDPAADRPPLHSSLWTLVVTQRIVDDAELISGFLAATKQFLRVLDRSAACGAGLSRLPVLFVFAASRRHWDARTDPWSGVGAALFGSTSARRCDRHLSGSFY